MPIVGHPNLKFRPAIHATIYSTSMIELTTRTSILVRRTNFEQVGPTHAQVYLCESSVQAYYVLSSIVTCMTGLRKSGPIRSLFDLTRSLQKPSIKKYIYC